MNNSPYFEQTTRNPMICLYRTRTPIRFHCCTKSKKWSLKKEIIFWFFYMYTLYNLS